MSKPDDIVSDAEVERVHGHANFGAITKRGIVDQGVLTYAFGYTTGYTLMTILKAHGLITIRGHGYSGSLTKKGQKYLRAMFRDVPLSRIAELRIATSADTSGKAA